MSFSSDVVIGLEIHVELNTKSKLFCSCSTASSAIPNCFVCPVCLGHPGSKPTPNKEAVRKVLLLSKALGCVLDEELVFARKSYFYPDMSKNFQVTQFDRPLGREGVLELRNGAKISISRVHLEEDPASLTHPSGLGSSEYSLIDYNRSGRPLAEVVTGPDITSASMAREFLEELLLVLSYTEVFDGDAVLKADANVSIRESGFCRVEIKNITGFKEVERALEFEISRQKKLVSSGKQVSLDTRLWNGSETVFMRSKESEEDYGYVFDADLAVVSVSGLEVEEVELPVSVYRRFVKLGLSSSDASVMASDKFLAGLFERLVASGADVVLVARWLRRELLRVLNYASVSVRDSPISFDQLTSVIGLLGSEKITENTAKKLMERLMSEDFVVEEIVKKEGLLVVRDENAIDSLVQEVVKEFPDAVKDVVSGEEKALNFLLGQVMRKSRGAADAEVAKKTLLRQIK